jgi:hypothetical protein
MASQFLWTSKSVDLLVAVRFWAQRRQELSLLCGKKEDLERRGHDGALGYGGVNFRH